jgi:hypothetical protein
MENEEELERLMREKDFATLTATEKQFVLEMLASAEEYDAMRNVGRAIEGGNFISTLQPRPQILAALRQQVKANQTPSFDWVGIFRIQVPAYVAVLAIVFFAGYIFWLRTPADPKPALSDSGRPETVTRIDTVFVTRIDTVVQEKIIYRQSHFVSTLPDPDPEMLAAPKRHSGSGVNMKEKEDLNRLLVSGSD